MVSITDRLARFARSPQGQRAMTKAKQFAEKPENRRRVEQLRERLVRRGRAQ